MKTVKDEQGLTIIEALIAIVIVVVISIASLSFYAYGLGNINKQGNQRAALELARARMEELLAADLDDISPSDNGIYWITCAGSPCVWTLAAGETVEAVTVNGNSNRRMETMVQWVDDPANITQGTDALELVTRVWYSSDLSDDDFHRVHIRSLRVA